MKILMVNKFFYIKGGSETYYFALKELLESKGHQVIDFSMEDEKNFESPFSEYFVKKVDYNKQNSLAEKIFAAANIIYSFEAKRKFEALVRKEKPDLVHLHIFQHQISPSILDVIKKYNLPTVYTAHDLKMVCLNYKMMHHGKICEDCKNGHYGYCVRNKCVKNSYAKSAINLCEGYIHKWRKSYEAIDVVVTPSEFYMEKMQEFGISKEKLVHIPNFLNRSTPPVSVREDAKQFYVYFGRISEEKGVLTMVKAFANTGWPLRIVGTGPLQESLKQYVSENRIENVEFLGFLSGQELTDVVGNAKAVIIPSEWYENGPYSAIEALQLSRPIIGAEIGGIPELVKNNGYLFESGNVDSLQKQLYCFENLTQEEYKKMERASYDLFKTTYSVEEHFKKLEKVYQSLIPEFR